MTRLVWFRSDLRLADNPAFHRALLDAGKSTPRTPVLAAFIVSAKEWYAVFLLLVLMLMLLLLLLMLLLLLLL